MLIEEIPAALLKHGEGPREPMPFRRTQSRPGSEGDLLGLLIDLHLLEGPLSQEF